ncbi:MAG: hypothetical protein AB1671_22025 [Thermodesulfobacteriota bacterium]
MNRKMSLYVWSAGLCGALLLAAPTWGRADDDRWEAGQRQLEEQLPPGRTPQFYRQRLAELGYEITSVNDRESDYLEYEVVKGDRSYEVKLTLDEDTRRATDVDIDWNVWKADATEEALDEPGRTAASLDDRDYILVITPLYVASDQERTRMEQMVQELEQLPVGRNREFYRRALERRGYQIIDTARKDDRVQFHATKDGQDILLMARFGEENGQSEQVSAFPLLVTAQGQREQEGMSSQRSRTARQSNVKQGNVKQMEQELESLPVGRDRQFYRQALRERGYRITDVITEGNQVRFEVEKNGQPMAVVVNFADETAQESSAVYAFPAGQRQARVSR